MDVEGPIPVFTLGAQVVKCGTSIIVVGQLLKITDEHVE